MKRTYLALILIASCTDSSDISIEIPFAIPATNEISSTSTGSCGWAPVTQAGGLYKPKGLLELDPVLNKFPEYELAVQVENYLDTSCLTDSNGNCLSGANRNDFQVQRATIKYIDVEGNLASAPAPHESFVSANVPTGGLQAATAVVFNTVPSDVAAGWVSDFNSVPALLPSDGGVVSPVEDVILEVQLLGVLSSGESVSSGKFHFPLTLCFNCNNLPVGNDGITPACPGSRTTFVPVGQGPCCHNQDFTDICSEEGNAAGEPCSTALGCTMVGTTMLTCAGPLFDACGYPGDTLTCK